MTPQLLPAIRKRDSTAYRASNTTYSLIESEDLNKIAVGISNIDLGGDIDLDVMGEYASTQSLPDSQQPQRAQTAPAEISLAGLHSFIAAAASRASTTLGNTGTSTPWITTAMSPSTQRQNAQVSALLALMKAAAAAEGSDRRGGGIRQANSDRGSSAHDEGESDDGIAQRERAARFERSLAEIQGLLEHARNLDTATPGSAVSRGTNINTAIRPNPASKTRKLKSAISSAHQLNLPNAYHPSVNQSSVIPGGDGLKMKFGRRPIKLIAAELKKRIELLKSNQTEWEVFQEKISSEDPIFLI
ncbi:hypothetical protein HDU82_008024 [Entophlyctis luteolus]|nr:hypothetical protein HDU82_008024 [Entophlyctis luteolus]